MMGPRGQRGEERPGRRRRERRSRGPETHSRHMSLSKLCKLITVSLKREDILRLRLLHAFLEILPLLRPGAAVHVGYLVLDHLAGVHARRNALDRVDRRNALDEGQGIALLEAAHLDVV